MQIQAIMGLPGSALASGPKGGPVSFESALGSAVDNLSASLARADALAASVTSGKANVADVTIARAKADVMLEVAAITAARVSGVITQLLQTQV
jgi:flagellar hook-basal body complex protein FliE